ncbi:hypothetical protein KAR91_55845 [Candidatus Pacearchaeota archaeon]|nr:hypothetical protein [Candidatus Pacearchaeota archaeon]
MGSSNTVKGSNTSESEVEIDQKADIEVESESKSKSSSEGGGEFVPPGQQDKSSEEEKGIVKSLSEKLLPAKKKSKKSKA